MCQGRQADESLPCHFLFNGALSMLTQLAANTCHSPQIISQRSSHYIIPCSMKKKHINQLEYYINIPSFSIPCNCMSGFCLNMAAGCPKSTGIPKLRLWQRCSKLVKEQRTRFYIIWRCMVLLLRWEDC